jgi:hypothetical protein
MNRKSRLILQISIIFILVISLMIVIGTHPERALISSTLGNVAISGITLIVLFLTWDVYRDLLKVSVQTLTFTKTQTVYNSYFDNYKLFFELSKMKTDKVSKGMINDNAKVSFDELTFSTIQSHYINIFGNVPDSNRNDARIWFELIFKRFNYKIQSFIDLLLNEIVKIKAENNLSSNQKEMLINLYKNFIMTDYIFLCKDLIQNRDYNRDNPSDSILQTNFLKINTKTRMIFDLDNFLKLYNEMEKVFENMAC